jgi:hypothetical protein
MTRALEIRTPHTDVSDVVRDLAPAIDDESIRLPAEQPIGAGEWVRFAVTLADGTTVFEGIGRSQGSTAEAGSTQVSLSALQLDARNEVMYERMLLMRDAEQEKTGTIDLDELVAELVRGPSRSVRPPTPGKARPSALPPLGSVPPPAPAAGRRPPAPSSPPPRPKPVAAAPPAARPSAKPEPTRPEPAKAVPRPAMPAAPSPPSPAAAATRRPSPARPAAAKPAAPTPAQPSAPTSAQPAAPSRAAAAPASRPAPSSARPASPAPTPAGAATAELLHDARTTERALPPPAADRRRRRRPARVEVGPVSSPPQDMVTRRPAERDDDEPLRLEVPAPLVARARALAFLLPDDLFDRRRAIPEEAVLRAALRLGLASLAALRDDD